MVDGEGVVGDVADNVGCLFFLSFLLSEAVEGSSTHISWRVHGGIIFGRLAFLF